MQKCLKTQPRMKKLIQNRSYSVFPHDTFQKLIGVGLKNKTVEYYIFLNYIGFNFLTVIMCTICCVCMKYGVSKEERHNGYQFFIKSQFHFFKTINIQFNLTQSKWNMGNIFGLKFHLSYMHAPQRFFSKSLHPVWR